jgi:hypothetical protein
MVWCAATQGLSASSGLAFSPAKEAKQLASSGEPSSLRWFIYRLKSGQCGRSKERKNMKAFVGVLTVFAVAVAFALNASAADVKTGKGKGPVIVPGENILMTCPHCKDDYVVKLTKPAKGTEAEKAVVAKHLCEKCSTTLVTKGAGKAKTEVTEHSCKGCKT